eukprot:jgi/Pico_ML_1/54996/g121.t1
MNFLGFGTPCRVEVEFRGGQDQRTIKVKKKKSDVVEELPLFRTGDTLSGQIKVIPLPGKKVDHAGIKVELIGQIDLQHDRGGSYDFLSLVREVEPAGEMYTTKAMPFEFNAVEMQYESYAGIHVQLRYLLRVTITRNYAVNIVKERHFWVENPSALPEGLTPIKMEVGIEDCLHIEFEYNKGHYHLKDVVVGKIYFMLVRIRLKHMELEIRKRETCGSGTHTHNESETLAKYEIMDGAPVRGESIPIRLFLSPYQLTPTYKNINNKFSVRYFINLVLVDEEDRRLIPSYRWSMKYTTAATASGRLATAKATLYALGPTHSSAVFLPAAIPLCTIAKMRSNHTTAAWLFPPANPCSTASTNFPPYP